MTRSLWFVLIVCSRYKEYSCAADVLFTRTLCSSLIAVSCIMVAGSQSGAAAAKKLVAHRGASAYAPEHTLASYRLALEQHADYVEQDLAVTKDLALICLHDESLERTTNVEELFPDRSGRRSSHGQEAVARRRFHAGRDQTARRRIVVRRPIRE
jgi:glycerophosphoryl diester phosphodiesterase